MNSHNAASHYSVCSIGGVTGVFTFAEVKAGGKCCSKKDDEKLEDATKIRSFFSTDCFCWLIAIETSHQPKKELLLASVGRKKEGKEEKYIWLKWRFLLQREERWKC